MKPLLAALLALAQASQAAAPKIVVTPKAGLGGQGVTLAKPGILNNGLANPLGGNPLANNVPALVNAGVPALAPNVSQAPVLDGLTNVVDKQAELGQDQTSEHAVLGGNLFDGSGKAELGDAGGPVNGGFGGGDPYRTSGLSPPTREDVSRAYRKVRYNSDAMAHFGSQFPDAAAEVIYKFTFQGYDMLSGLAEAARVDRGAKELFDAVTELIGVHEGKDDASLSFLETLGAWYAGADSNRQKGRGPGKPHMPPNPLEGGEYWDMAAGMNAGGYVRHEVDSKSDYSFFDISPFVVSYLNESARLAGKPNARAVQANLLSLRKPARPLSVLRTKNAVAYVPGFESKLEEMADWIAPKGQLIVQNDPNPGQRSLIVKKHGPLIRKLLAQGWSLEYGFSRKEGPLGKYAFDTLILTRPAAPKALTSHKARELWDDYVRAVRKADQDFNPFGGFFTVVLGG